MKTFSIFPGNCPHNVSKDAKYGVSGSDGRVRLLYSTPEGERWHLTTKAHPALVEMVNDVKRTHGGRSNGPFYINEYKQVIVPVGDGPQYYFAGTYAEPLKFHFEGKTISGQPFDLNGNALRPGDTWTGPHAGIPYVLTAVGNDVYYKTFPRPQVEARVKLSTKRGRTAAEQIARLLSAYKGNGGGRFYVNEFCCVFSRINGTDGWHYIYFGQLDLNAWFPNPLNDITGIQVVNTLQ